MHKSRYGLKEMQLAKTLAIALHLSSQTLALWDDLDRDFSGLTEGKYGCLGLEVEAALRASRVVRLPRSPLRPDGG